MTKASADLSVVADLDRETVSKICAAFDKALMSNPDRMDVLRGIVGEPLDDNKLGSILSVLHSFATSKPDQRDMITCIDSCDLSLANRTMLKDMSREIRDKADPNYANRKAFEAFVDRHKGDARFKHKYVAFVHGKYRGSDLSMTPLVHRMYDEFGNVEMYVDKISPDKHEHMIATLPWP